MRDAAIATALAALALFPSPTLAAVDDGFCGPGGLTQNNVPSDDYAACGLSESELWGFNTNLYVQKKCTNAACHRIFAFLTSTYPDECLVSRGQPIPLHANVLEPLAKSCAALAAATPSPPAPAPTAAPAPAPTPGPAPVPTPAPVQAPTATPPRATQSPIALTPSSSSPGSTLQTPTGLSPQTSPSPGASQSASSASTAEGATAIPTANSQASSDNSHATTADDASATTPSKIGETSTNTTTNMTQEASRAPVSTSVDVANSSGSKSSSTTWIAGSISAAVVVIAVLCGFFFHRRRRGSAAKQAASHYFTETGTEPTTGDINSQDTLGLESILPREHHAEMDAMLRGDTTLEAWRLFSKQIREKKFLGKGSHAFVHLVELSNGTLLASKRLAQDQATPKHLSQLLSEVHIVSTLSHGSIVEFKGVAWTSARDFQVLFEYMRGGDLREYLDKTPIPPSPSYSVWTRTKLQIVLSIAEGLAYAHSFTSPLVHRDLKSRNILLTEDRQAKISDFGVSRFQSENDTMTTGVGTNRWLAPEVLVGGGTYNEKCDIYSFGVVMTELDTHAVPLEKEIEALRSSTTISTTGRRNRSELWVLREIANGTLRPTMSSSGPSEIRDLVRQCLALDPNNRPVALEVSYRLRKLLENR